MNKSAVQLIEDELKRLEEQKEKQIKDVEDFSKEHENSDVTELPFSTQSGLLHSFITVKEYTGVLENRIAITNDYIQKLNEDLKKLKS